MNNIIYIDIENLNKELSVLKEEYNKLLIIKDKIKNNYERFISLSMEGAVIEEIKNNYEYGIENTEILLKELENEIEKITFAKNKYSDTLSKIDEKVGETNV